MIKETELAGGSLLVGFFQCRHLIFLNVFVCGLGSIIFYYLICKYEDKIYFIFVHFRHAMSQIFVLLSHKDENYKKKIDRALLA